MYNLININIDNIININDRQLQNHVVGYNYLINNLQLVNSPAYQNNYKHFWRMRFITNPVYLGEYFTQLSNALINIPNMEVLLRNLYEIPIDNSSTQTLQYSFVTKMLHMANNNRPIYDDNIAQFYLYTKPTSSLRLDNKIESFIQFYEFLESEYSRIITQGLLANSIQYFRHLFPNGNFTDKKIIDTLIWSFVNKCNNGGIVNGQIVYQ